MFGFPEAAGQRPYWEAVGGGIALPLATTHVFRPRKSSTMLYVVFIGPGGGGAGGFSAASLTTRGGGGGGGASPLNKFLLPVAALPRGALYLKIAGVQPGGAAGVGGTGSGSTVIALHPSNVAGTTIELSASSQGSGASPGSAVAGGPGSSSTASSAIVWVAFGPATPIGVTGGPGGFNAAGTSLTTTLGRTTMATPGSGGGGVTSADVEFAGGAINALTGIHNGLPGGAIGGGRGQDGFQVERFMFLGGTGGGSSGTGTGGAGGNGAIGCGGGGGGAGVTGGRGGDGGPGAVWIWEW
jgi:hypothetical protein